MKKFARVLISSTLICFAYVGTTLGVPVTIDPGAYMGQWTVDYGSAQKGIVVVDLTNVNLTDGFHVISISGAEIFFKVAKNGKVRVKNHFAATGGAGVLTFNTTTIKVDPGLFEGYWRVSGGATPDLAGPYVVTLVPGLRFYSLAIGANGGFSFDIKGDGTVMVRNNIAASGGVGTLEFKNTRRFKLSDEQRPVGPRPFRPRRFEPRPVSFE